MRAHSLRKYTLFIMYLCSRVSLRCFSEAVGSQQEYSGYFKASQRPNATTAVSADNGVVPGLQLRSRSSSRNTTAIFPLPLAPLSLGNGGRGETAVRFLLRFLLLSCRLFLLLLLLLSALEVSSCSVNLLKGLLTSLFCDCR